MIIYHDIISNDEVLSDTFKVVELKEANGLLKAMGKLRTDTDAIDESAIGANPSAEECEQQSEQASKTDMDIVMNHRLVETKFGTKKELQGHLKDYCKKLLAKLEEVDKEKAAEFKKAAGDAVKYLLGNFKDLEFYMVESMNVDAALMFKNYEEDGITPYLLYFKHALVEEKV